MCRKRENISLSRTSFKTSYFCIHILCTYKLLSLNIFFFIFYKICISGIFFINRLKIKYEVKYLIDRDKLVRIDNPIS